MSRRKAEECGGLIGQVGISATCEMGATLGGTGQLFFRRRLAIKATVRCGTPSCLAGRAGAQAVHFSNPSSAFPAKFI